MQKQFLLMSPHLISYLCLMSTMQALIEKTNKTGKLAFAKTRETQVDTRSSFKVTLGIMPDYTFNGIGVRVDGVSDNKPAQKAGSKTGDVILSIGDFKTTSLEGYMQVLGKFKKGDKATVTYARNGQTLSSAVEF